MALAKYDKVKNKEYKKSGVESPNNKNVEMEVIYPYVINPDGKYRAVDPTDGWLGWVQYTPEALPSQPPVIVEPLPVTKEEQDKYDWIALNNKMGRLEVAVSRGLIKDSDEIYIKTKSDYISKFKPEYIDLL
jgi:hypothetical protein